MLVGVSVGVLLKVAVAEGVFVGVSVAVAVAVGVFVEVNVDVAVAVGVLVAVDVLVGVFVKVLVGVGDAAEQLLRSRTETFAPLRLAATRSCLPSPLKSPTATA